MRIKSAPPAIKKWAAAEDREQQHQQRRWAGCWEGAGGEEDAPGGELHPPAAERGTAATPPGILWSVTTC